MTLLVGQRVSRKPRRHIEDALQVSIAGVLHRALPPAVFWFAVPNGGARVKKQDRQGNWYSPEAKRMKAMGVKAGVPDLGFVYRGHAYFIELKTDDGTLSPEQRRCISDLALAGANTAVCRSMKAVLHQLRSWDIPVRAKVMA